MLLMSIIGVDPTTCGRQESELFELSEPSEPSDVHLLPRFVLVSKVIAPTEFFTITHDIAEDFKVAAAEVAVAVAACMA